MGLLSSSPNPLTCTLLTRAKATASERLLPSFPLLSFHSYGQTVKVIFLHEGHQRPSMIGPPHLSSLVAHPSSHVYTFPPAADPHIPWCAASPLMDSVNSMVRTLADT